MKKKITILLIVFILLFSSYAFAYDYNRTGGTPLWSSEQATYITQDTTLDAKYNAESIGVKNRKVEYFNGQLKKLDEQRMESYWKRNSEIQVRLIIITKN